jgi:hypothetical protein
MDGAGYRAMSAYGIIAATTIALQRELIHNRATAGSDSPALIFETAAGRGARARPSDTGGLNRSTSTPSP